MNTAIIIATHGDAAESLLNTTQMIVGQQENVYTVTFFPGENVDTLIAKYNSVLQNVNQQDGVIFLVDIYAGSPFNAASVLAINKPNWDVVTGVNIPMLVNLFLERESIGSYDQLIDMAKEMAKEGVKSLKESLNNNVAEQEL